MRYTAEQLQAMLDMRARNELRVTVGDRTLQYGDMPGLETAIAQAKRDVASAQAGAYRGTTRYAKHDRGY